MSRRHNDAVETIKLDGFTAYVLIDEEPQSPKEWDQFGTLITWHRRYQFDKDGQKEGYESGQDWLDAMQADIESERLVYINVAMIDHSGLSFYEGRGAHACDPGGWDSGQVGFLYGDRERWDKVVGGEWSVEKAKEVLRSELNTWDQYVRGDVYGVVVERDADGEDVESCWGFYGSECAVQEAKSMLESVVSSEKKDVVMMRAYGSRL